MIAKMKEFVGTLILMVSEEEKIDSDQPALKSFADKVGRILRSAKIISF